MVDLIFFSVTTITVYKIKAKDLTGGKNYWNPFALEMDLNAEVALLFLCGIYKSINSQDF